MGFCVRSDTLLLEDSHRSLIADSWSSPKLRSVAEKRHSEPELRATGLDSYTGRFDKRVRKRIVATTVLGLAISIVVASASTAVAFPSKSSSCTNCHDLNTAIAITTTQTSNNGTTATYKVSVSNPYSGSMTGWALFDGSSNVKHGYGPGSFSATVGKTYKVWGVAGGGGKGADSIKLTPSAPGPQKTASSLKATTSSVVSYHAKAKVTGTLTTAAGSALVGKRITLQTSVDGSTWKSFDATTTVAGGAYKLYSPALTTARYVRARFGGDATYAAASSRATVVKPKVYFSSAPKFSTYTHTYGTSYKVWGYLKPKHASGSTQIKVKAYRRERQSNGTYKYVWKKTYSTKISNPSGSAYSKYTGYVKLPYKGTWRLRAHHAADTKNASSYSTYRAVTVK